MSQLSRLLRKRREGARPPLEQRYRSLLERCAPGRSVIDVGCLWQVHGAYAFHAAAHNASRVAAFDRAPASPEFNARNVGNQVRFIRGDINDSRIIETVGPWDVVFCAGVLHHMPNPVYTLTQLRAICEQTLILGLAITAEVGAPQTAIFLPHLDPLERERLAAGGQRGVTKRGLDTEFEADKEYGNWFWLLTPSCVRAMLRVAGFEAREEYPYRHALCLVCRPT